MLNSMLKAWPNGLCILIIFNPNHFQQISLKTPINTKRKWATTIPFKIWSKIFRTSGLGSKEDCQNSSLKTWERNLINTSLQLSLSSINSHQVTLILSKLSKTSVPRHLDSTRKYWPMKTYSHWLLCFVLFCPNSEALSQF
jgi:hypothetical protein